jgi:hypothetical protein
MVSNEKIIIALVAVNIALVFTGVYFVLYEIGNVPECPDCELECPEQRDYTTELQSLEQLIGAQDVLLEQIHNKDCMEVTDMMFIDAARDRFMGVHEWTWETDCDVLTQEFTVIMKEFGIPMHKIYAWPENSNVGHAYNCIPYDVQVGLTDDSEWSRRDLVQTTLSYEFE